MAKKLKLQVPTPCHENWENMSPAEKGRFCASCQKQVIDFSNKSDREIAMFFKKPSTGSVCGRFMNDQLNRNIEIPKKRIPWLKYFFQFAIPAFLASCDHRTQGKVKVADTFTTVGTDGRETEETRTVGMIMPEIIEKYSATGTSDTLPEAIQTITETCTTTGLIAPEIIVGDTIAAEINECHVDTFSLQTTTNIFPDSDQVNNEVAFWINGKIIDEAGKPIAFATVAIKGTRIAVAADSAGRFTINPKLNWQNITLSVSCVGFTPLEKSITRSDYSNDVEIELQQTASLGEAVIVNSFETHRKGLVSGSFESDRPNLTVSDIFKPKSNFRIYPNPVRPSSTLTIEWKQKEFGDHLLQLFNQSGQLILSKDIYIDEKARLFTMNMPMVIAGNYFLELSSKATGRTYTEKLIVE